MKSNPFTKKDMLSILNDSSELTDIGNLQLILEETMLDLKRESWPRVFKRVKTQNLKSYFLGVTKEGVIRFRTTSGTTRGLFWYQDVYLEDLPDAISMVQEDKSFKPRDAILLAMKGNVKVHCFPPGVLVKTNKSKVPIEKVTVGTKVKGSDCRYHYVTKVHKSEYKGYMIRLSIMGIDYTEKELLLTPNHLIGEVDIHCEDRRIKWVSARDIEPGALLQTSYSAYDLVRSKDKVYYDGFVYNLSVEGSHTYFANDILVHNCNCPAWKYWGWQYIGTRRGYALRSNRRFPKKRNPRLTGSTCKHLLSVFEVIPFNWSKIVRAMRERKLIK